MARAEKVMESPGPPYKYEWRIETRFRPLIVANLARLCHKRNLHRPADQGLPCRCPCRLAEFSNIEFSNKSSTFNALTSILAGTAPLRAHHVRGHRRAKC